MSQTIQFRRGTLAESQGVVLAAGEPGYLTDKKRLILGDGSTAGGTPILAVDGPKGRERFAYWRMYDAGNGGYEVQFGAGQSLVGNQQISFPAGKVKIGDLIVIDLFMHLSNQGPDYDATITTLLHLRPAEHQNATQYRLDTPSTQYVTRHRIFIPVLGLASASLCGYEKYHNNTTRYAPIGAMADFEPIAGDALAVDWSLSHNGVNDICTMALAMFAYIDHAAE